MNVNVGKCELNKGNPTITFLHLTGVQNVLLQGIKVDKELADTLSPRMLANKIQKRCTNVYVWCTLFEASSREILY